MDRICRILWPYLWCGLLLCLLSIASYSEAATRKNVSMPSAQSVAQGAGAPSRNGDVLSIPGQQQGEYIPRTPGGTSGTPMKVLPTVDYSIPRTIKAASGVLRGGIIGAVAAAALQGMLDAVGGLIDEHGHAKLPSVSLDGDSATVQPSATTGSPPDACALPASQTMGKTLVKTVGSVTYAYGVKPSPVPYAPIPNVYSNCTNSDIGYNHVGGYFPQAWRKVISPADLQYGTKDLTEADFSTMEAAANAGSSDWLKDLINASCAGSLSPNRCYEDLKDNTSLSGPSTLVGPTTTSSSTYTKPDGTIGTGTSTTTTNYNIVYGPSHYDYSKTETTTVTKDGVPVSQETVTDGTDIDTEVPAEEEQEEQQAEEPSPCVSGCDGPAYEDLYTPTEEVKEDFLNDYMTRVSNLPILDAVAGMFTVSVGGSCPVWEYHGSLSMMGAAMPIDLTFDFFCLSWVVSLKPWLQVIFALIGSYMAIRVALL
jgi:hypothetical protein